MSQSPPMNRNIRSFKKTKVKVQKKEREREEVSTKRIRSPKTSEKLNTIFDMLKKTEIQDK